MTLLPRVQDMMQLQRRCMQLLRSLGAFTSSSLNSSHPVQLVTDVADLLSSMARVHMLAQHWPGPAIFQLFTLACCVHQVAHLLLVSPLCNSAGTNCPDKYYYCIDRAWILLNTMRCSSLSIAFWIQCHGCSDTSTLWHLLLARYAFMLHCGCCSAERTKVHVCMAPLEVSIEPHIRWLR